MDKLLYKKNTQNIDKQYKQNKMEKGRKYLDLPSGTSPSQVLAQPSNWNI